MHWDDVRYFLALSREGSVRAAGAALGVSHSTVARRVEALEERLEVRLFDRTPDGYVLTEGGSQMVPGAQRVEREIATLERELLGQDERLEGKITVTCADTYLSELVLAELAPFCRACPEIDLELTSSYRAVDLSKREADIALRVHRLGKLPPGHLLGRKVATLHYANYVSVEHCERLDPEIVGESESRWLGWGDRKADELWASKTSYPAVPVWGAFGGVGLQMQATRSGMGIACLPCYVADRDPALRRLKKADVGPFFDIWMLSHPDLRTTARLQAARDTLARAFSELESLFCGLDVLPVEE